MAAHRFFLSPNSRALGNMKLSIIRRTSETWSTCVTLVQERYAAAFGAEVAPDPDAFLTGRVLSDTGSMQLAACAGLTFGSARPFFSERYLDDKIEVLIGQRLGTSPDRQRIVEVGALAGGAAGSGKELIRVTPVISWCLGMQYIFCTATQPLTKTFNRLQIPFIPLCQASKSRLDPKDQERWGKYYENEPWAGVIPLTDIAPLFADATGRYSFSDPEITLLGDRHPHNGRPPESSRATHVGY